MIDQFAILEDRLRKRGVQWLLEEQTMDGVTLFSKYYIALPNSARVVALTTIRNFATGKYQFALGPTSSGDLDQDEALIVSRFTEPEVSVSDAGDSLEERRKAFDTIVKAVAAALQMPIDDGADPAEPDYDPRDEEYEISTRGGE